MKHLVSTFPVLLLVSIAAIGQGKVGSKVGIIEKIQGPGCLEIANSKLKPGQALKIVMMDRPQTVKDATILRKLRKSCLKDGDGDGGSYYSVRTRASDTFVATAIVGRPVSVSKGIAHTDLNGDGRPDYFRHCTTTETDHMTLWSGKPLVGRLIWHGSYNIGYATEANCTKKDLTALR